ncbi:MAG: FAD-dependent oxidoreductase [Planctomycetes bacterium]|nr:FAD-dependent oxidoreductase [Planctomycetota bacterium]
MPSADLDFDVLVVGAGPGGLAASHALAAGGRRVGLVDAGRGPGGQIDRPRAGQPPVRGGDGITVLARTEVVAARSATELLVDGPEGPRLLCAPHLVLATGARERYMPFPGWTLPGVFGVGGLQALAKDGYPLAGKRILVAGSGPLLLAAAAFFRKEGAEVAGILEQTPRAKWLGFAAGLALRQPSRAMQALGLRRATGAVPYQLDAWVTSARAGGAGLDVRAVVNGSERRFDCDHLACAFGLVPESALAQGLGCEVDAGHQVVVDENQASTVAGVYAVGEITGIGGKPKAILEGEVAAAAILGRRGSPGLRRRLTRERRFAERLDRAFALRNELRKLPQDDTIVCRCEDQRLGQAMPFGSWRAAKIHARFGMGACQGRICGPALEYLCGWSADGARPPIMATTLDVLAYAMDRSRKDET